MEKIGILKELKGIYEKQEFYKIKDLIDILELDINKEKYYKKPSDKKKISTIQKVLKNISDVRPILGCIGMDNMGNHLITDSYQAYILKEENYLPFNYALTSNATDDEKIKLIENNIKIYNGVYPNLCNILPCGEHKKVVLSSNTIINYIKTTPKTDGKCIYRIVDGVSNELSVAFDAVYMKNAIDILQLEREFVVEIYGKDRPIIIRNNDNIAVILPIRIY